MLWTPLLCLLVLWLLGAMTQIGGSHSGVLLVVALVVFLIELLSRRRVV